MKPGATEYSGYIGTYITPVKEDSVLEALEMNAKLTLGFLKSIPEEKTNLVYAPGKWSIKELLLHMIDTERIFSYRALAFARGEQQKMISFDENTYAALSNANTRSYSDLLEEFETVRKASLILFRSFSEKTLLNKGETPSGTCSVNAIGYAICGHCQHHLMILETRYLK